MVLNAFATLLTPPGWHCSLTEILTKSAEPAEILHGRRNIWQNHGTGCFSLHVSTRRKENQGFSWGMGGLTSVEVDIPHLYHIGNTSM